MPTLSAGSLRLPCYFWALLRQCLCLYHIVSTILSVNLISSEISSICMEHENVMCASQMAWTLPCTRHRCVFVYVVLIPRNVSNQIMFSHSFHALVLLWEAGTARCIASNERHQCHVCQKWHMNLSTMYYSTCVFCVVPFSVRFLWLIPIFNHISCCHSFNFHELILLWGTLCYLLCACNLSI